MQLQDQLVTLTPLLLHSMGQLPALEPWRCLSSSALHLQDMVARACKFVVLFKRPGHRVIINARGDMLVRPSFMEISTQRAGIGAALEGLWALHGACLVCLLLLPCSSTKLSSPKAALYALLCIACSGCVS